MTLARPNKTVGRIVLGPRVLGTDYVRIVARADGSGRIELYDKESQSWRDASEQWTFSDVWSASTAVSANHVALL
jgi:hypothetical protein